MILRYCFTHENGEYFKHFWNNLNCQESKLVCDLQICLPHRHALEHYWKYWTLNVNDLLQGFYFIPQKSVCGLWNYMYAFGRTLLHCSFTIRRTIHAHVRIYLEKKRVGHSLSSPQIFPLNFTNCKIVVLHSYEY